MSSSGKLVYLNSHDDTRRSAEREPAGEGWVATLFPVGGGQELVGRVADTSPGGVGLALPAPLNPEALSEELIVTIHSPSRQLTRRARLRWQRSVNGEWRLGVAYLDHVSFDPERHALNLAAVRIDPACALRIPAHLAVRRKVLPFAELDGVVHLACLDPQDGQTLQVVERLMRKPLRAWSVDEETLEAALRKVYGDPRELLAPPSAVRPATENEAVVRGDDILNAAFLRQASDVHLDPTPEGVRVRLRVDGQLEFYAQYSTGVYQELLGRFKVMAGMDIAEKRAPQDGRFSFQPAGAKRRIDVRAATLPTKYGERMTLRLLAVQTDELTLDKLGLSAEHRETMEIFLRRSQGMMILTGPTGSGKSTTLYAALRMLLNERQLNVVTVEDPIEYEIPGVAQCEVDTADKVSFSKALRSILRHDPDVVMIGEIRDRETADVAIKAALTGHLVLGTLHTNSAAASVTRLLDMGVEPFLVAATLRLAVAQRLVRRLCAYCRIPRPLTLREALALGREELAGCSVYEPAGCLYCNNRGFTGRLGIYELLSMNPEWARGIAQGAGESRLLGWMRQERVRFLLDDAIDKMLAGQTPVSEVMTVALSW